MSDSSAEILFLRVPPRGLVKPARSSAWIAQARLPAVYAPNGFCGRVGERSITCFWAGMGRRVRVPGQKLLERIRGGTVQEIIDIGCAGALDPSLRRGDLVLSSNDIAFDGGVQLVVRRGPELGSFLKQMAGSRGVSLRQALILTHERFINNRDERIELFERTGCVAVQMEHVWFLQLLHSLVSKRCLDQIRFTHLVLITDTVPRNSSRMAAARSAWEALRGYTLPGRRDGIASLRREVLSRWPAW